METKNCNSRECIYVFLTCFCDKIIHLAVTYNFNETYYKKKSKKKTTKIHKTTRKKIIVNF